MSAADTKPAPPPEPTPPPIFHCPSELTIITAGDLKDRLLELIEAPLAVDVSDVRRIDSAGLHVLAAAATSWKRRSLALTWIGQSRALDEAVSLSGLASVLGTRPVT